MMALSLTENEMIEIIRAMIRGREAQNLPHPSEDEIKQMVDLAEDELVGESLVRMAINGHLYIGVDDGELVYFTDESLKKKGKFKPG
jgi:hypothetical protein